MKKVNKKALLVGLLALMLSFIAFYFTWTDRNIRLNGTIIKAPIVEFYGRLSRPNGGSSVLIIGKKLNAGHFDKRGYSLGDLIEVCYIPGEYCVCSKKNGAQKILFVFFT